MITEHEMLVTIASMALRMNDLCGYDVLKTLKELGHGWVIVEARKLTPSQPKRETDLVEELADLFGLSGEHRTPERVAACARHALNQLRLSGGGDVS